jgi:hypothetical protein
MKLGDVMETFSWQPEIEPSLKTLETSSDLFERINANSTLMSVALKVSNGDALLAADIMGQVHKVLGRAVGIFIFYDRSARSP